MSLISYEESLRLLVDAAPAPKGRENLFLSDIRGRVLADDIVATHNSPQMPTASMDGYAIRFSDQRLKELRVIDVNPAGSEIASEVTQGVCIKTFTGSLMPKGADTLIPIENVTAKNSLIVIDEDVPHGFSVRPVAEDYADGDKLIKKGTFLGFAHIGVMASLGEVMIPVQQKPRVAILATGSEILDVGKQQKSIAQIRSSNSYTIEAIAAEYGAKVLQHGVVEDSKQAIREAINEALKGADIIVTTGGVSVGDFDYVKDIIQTSGFETLFKGVNIKPGRHIIVAKKENQFIVSLPGFAYSSTVTFLLYGVPLIRSFLDREPMWKKVNVRLKERWVKRVQRSEFTACNIYEENGELVADFSGKRVGSSGILTNMLGPVALLFREKGGKTLQEGDTAEAIALKEII